MIRDRAAKFYRDHTAGCNIFIAGLVTGVVVANKSANKRLAVTSADMWMRDDGAKVLLIEHKNGSQTKLKYTNN